MALYLKQLLAGRDFAITDQFASQMANFVYVVGDDETRQCMLVDPAWDVSSLLDFLDREEMQLTGVLVSHYHPDHVGGVIFGYHITGIAELLSRRPVKVHVNAHEKEGVKVMTGLSDSDLVPHEGGGTIQIGATQVKFVHTPGHTPGSQCFLVDVSLISGDTLFVGGCGRVDLPGGDAEQMYYSLTQVLSKLPDDTKVYPGHDYASKPVTTIGDEKRENQYLQVRGLDDWLRLMGRT